MNIPSKSAKMSSKFPPILSSLEQKLKKNSSISQQELTEDLKSLLKTHLPQFTTLISSITPLLIHYKQPFNPLMKALSHIQFKDSLKITCSEEIKHLLNPLFDFYQKNSSEETNLLTFLKILTKFRFQNFTYFEKSLIFLLDFLNFHMNELKIHKENLTNNQIYLLKLLMNVFMNITSKMPEFKEQETKKIVQQFNEKIQQIFFKIPIDFRLQQENFLKFLISLFRILNFFLEKMENFAKDFKLLETIFINVYKFSFIGTVFQKGIFGNIEEKTVSTYIFNENNQNEMSSSSEFSDFESLLQNGNRLEEIYVKIRNYACLCLQTAIKISPKIVVSQWNKLFKSNIFSKDFVDFLRNTTISKENVKKNCEKKFFQANYSEPSVFFLLISEKSAKVRINLLNFVLLIIDNLPIKQWLAGFSREKTKAKKEAFQPISHQIYNSIKNLNYTVLFMLFLEENVQVLSHILKIYAGIIANSCFEKLTEDILNLSFSNYLFPLFNRKKINEIEEEKLNSHEKSNENEKSIEKYEEKHNENLPIQANSLACISVLLNLSIKLNKIEEIYLKNPESPTNLLKIVLITLQSLFQKETNETEALILIMESLNFLAKIQKNYHIITLKFLDFLIECSNLLEHQSIHKEIHIRETIGFYKVLEELTKANNPNLSNEEDLDEEFPEKTLKIPILAEEFTIEFLLFLKKKIFFGLNHENLDLNISTMNILANLKGFLWEFLKEETQNILFIIEKLSQKNNTIKTAIFRTLGVFSEHSIFLSNSIFSNKILEILVKGGSNLKNFNAKIKNSWALSNWLSKTELFSNDLTMINPLFQYILVLCEDSKEKVASNGLRSLGFFLKNLSKQQFSLIYNEKFTKELRNIFKKAFMNENPKVIWNTCVSLRNLLISEKKELIVEFFDAEIYEKLLEILKEKANFKSQIHSIKTLLVFDEQKIIEITYKKTLLMIIEALKQFDTEDYSFLEYRSIDLLKFLLIELLFKRILSEIDEELLIELFFHQMTNLSVFSFVNQFVHLIKENYQKYTGNYAFDENVEEEKLKKTMGFKGKLEINKGMNKEINKEIDDIPVKGEETISNIRLEMKALEKKQSEELEERLIILKKACAKICQMIDSHEKISIPFIFYDTMKEYSDLDLEKEEIDLKIIQKGLY